MEIEKFDSDDQFPKGGVEISLRHFLEVPLLPEFSRDSADDSHEVIKFWSDDDDGVHHSVCGSVRTVDSSFFTFTENRHFCTYAGITFNRYFCRHNFPKTFAISQNMDYCRNETYKSLRLWCLADNDNNWKKLTTEMEKVNHKLVTRQKTEEDGVSPETCFKVEIKDGKDWKPINKSEKEISQNEICRLNGLIEMGSMDLFLSCSQNHEMVYMQLVPTFVPQSKSTEIIKFDGDEYLQLGECKGREKKMDCECKCSKCIKWSSAKSETLAHS